MQFPGVEDLVLSTKTDRNLVSEEDEIIVSRDKPPICFFAMDQGLVTRLWYEGNKLHRAAMVLFTTPQLMVYL